MRQITRAYGILMIMMLLITSCQFVSDGREENRQMEQTLQSTEWLKRETYDAITTLRDDFRIVREDFIEMPLNSIGIGEQYQVRWAGDGVGPSIIVIFANVNGKWEPIYSGDYGRDILNVTLDTYTFGDRLPLVQVESYYPAGMQPTTKAKLLRIDGEHVNEVWETVSVTTVSRTNEKGQLIYENYRQSHALHPAIIQVPWEINAPEIHAWGVAEVITMEGEKILSNKEESIRKIFSWDEHKGEFVER